MALSIINDEIYDYPRYNVTDPMAVLSGYDFFDKRISSVSLRDMHTLVIGASNMGKTFAIRNMLRQTITNPNSRHIIFDPKGEFCQQFYREGTDYVISLFDVPGIRGNVKWKLLKDAAIDNHPETAIDEIAKAICKEAVEKNKTNPFFPQAAESLIAATWKMVYRRYPNNLPHNGVLIRKTRSLTREELINEANRVDANGNRINADILPVINKILDPNGGVATANVKQEMETILAQVFNSEGNFCSEGDFSVRDFIRNKENIGKRLFLVFDFATAESSKQVFGTLLDLMMKESLSIMEREEGERTYYYLDEFPVLPNNVSRVGSLCNFGRSMGNRVILGTQSLPALYDVYGEHASHAMLSAFTNNIIMGLNDPVTISKLAERSGRKTSPQTTMGLARNSFATNAETTYRIPEEVMARLSTGEAIISINGVAPFYIRLDP